MFSRSVCGCLEKSRFPGSRFSWLPWQHDVRLIEHQLFIALWGKCPTQSLRLLLKQWAHDHTCLYVSRSADLSKQLNKMLENNDTHSYVCVCGKYVMLFFCCWSHTQTDVVEFSEYRRKLNGISSVFIRTVDSAARETVCGSLNLSLSQQWRRLITHHTSHMLTCSHLSRVY